MPVLLVPLQRFGGGGYAPPLLGLRPRLMRDGVRLDGRVPAVGNLPTATLTTVIQLTGATIPAVSNLPTVALTTVVQLASSGVAAIAALTGALTTSIQMVGSSAAVSALPTAVLTTVIQLVGAAIGAVSNLPTAALSSAGATFLGTVSAVSGVSPASLLTGILLAGSVAASSSLTGKLLGRVKLMVLRQAYPASSYTGMFSDSPATEYIDLP